MKSRTTFMAILLTGLLAASVNVFGQPNGNNKSTCCDLKSDMRKLWEDHIIWTRNVILNIIDELPGTTQAVDRLLQNQDDIGNAIKPFYGDAAGTQLSTLLRQHITIAADLLTALDDGNTAAFNTANAQWIANADAIAAFLSGANPNWPLAEMKSMLYDHLNLTAAEALARKNANYTADVTAFENVHIQILNMADMLTQGIIKQFPNMFRGCGGEKNNKEITTRPGTLNQNSPNPFTSNTVISFTIPENVKQAQLVIYDDMGYTVKKFEIHTRGEGKITFQGSNLEKGIYLYSLYTDGNLVDTKKMIR